MNSAILDQADLALLRAALRYWLDEMSPHDAASWETYFTANEAVCDGSAFRAVQLLKTLETVELRYFVVDFDGSDIFSNSLVTEKPNSSQLAGDSEYGTALLSKRD